jgi:hypothetical protein
MYPSMSYQLMIRVAQPLSNPATGSATHVDFDLSTAFVDVSAAQTCAVHKKISRTWSKRTQRSAMIYSQDTTRALAQETTLSLTPSPRRCMAYSHPIPPYNTVVTLWGN